MSDLLKHQRQLLGIAKGWALKNLPGWADECHRDLIARHGAQDVEGRVSACTMNLPQLAAALDDYEQRGWPRRKTFQRAGTVKAIPPHVSHIVRLWGRLGQAGKLQRATRPALLAFCARQTGHDVPNLDILTTKEGQAVTEALKSWLARC